MEWRPREVSHNWSKERRKGTEWWTDQKSVSVSHMKSTIQVKKYLNWLLPDSVWPSSADRHLLCSTLCHHRQETHRAAREGVRQSEKQLKAKREAWGGVRHKSSLLSLQA